MLAVWPTRQHAVGFETPQKNRDARTESRQVLLRYCDLQGGGDEWKVYEPKWGPLFWLEFRPCFDGLTYKNRGQDWVLGILNMICIYTC